MKIKSLSETFFEAKQESSSPFLIFRNIFLFLLLSDDNHHQDERDEDEEDDAKDGDATE